MALNREGILEVVVRGKNNTLQHLRQNPDLSWNFNGIIAKVKIWGGKPIMTLNRQGRLESFLWGDKLDHF